MQIAVRDLQGEVAGWIPGDPAAVGIEARTIEVVTILAGFAPGEDAAFELKVAPADPRGRHPEGDVGGILPVMADRRVWHVHRAWPMHECGRAEGRLPRVAEVEKTRELVREPA